MLRIVFHWGFSYVNLENWNNSFVNLEDELTKAIKSFLDSFKLTFYDTVNVYMVDHQNKGTLASITHSINHGYISLFIERSFIDSNIISNKQENNNYLFEFTEDFYITLSHEFAHLLTSPSDVIYENVYLKLSDEAKALYSYDLEIRTNMLGNFIFNLMYKETTNDQKVS